MLEDPYTLRLGSMAEKRAEKRAVWRRKDGVTSESRYKCDHIVSSQ